MKPLLTLCMIVKDEAHTIARTLRSALPFVDAAIIHDTGSTDDTAEIARVEIEERAKVPGGVFAGGFDDFASTRNRLLAHAQQGTVTAPDPSEFLLLLDADDILDGGEALRTFLQDAMPLTEEQRRVATSVNPSTREDAFHVTMRQGSCAWPSARVVRADAGWRYVGAVHEVLCHPERPAPSITIPGVTIRHEQSTPDRQRARWERDLALIARDLERDPENPRALYYYALTLRRLGRFAESIPWFERRAAFGRQRGFWQEAYDSLFERASCLLRTGDAQSFVLGMLDAHAIDPRRAEPLVALAEHYLTRKPPGFGPAFTFALRAFELAKRAPEDALFLHADVYEWRAASVLGWAAFYVGEYDIGEAAARLALERGPEHLREHHAKNLSYYTERKR